MDKKLDIYKKDITKKYNKYSNEELLQFHIKGQYDKIIEGMLPMVIHYTKQYNQLDYYEDIVGVGNLSVVTSVNKFDPTKTKGTIISYIRTMLVFDVCNYLREYGIIIKYPSKYTNNKFNNVKMIQCNIEDLNDYSFNYDEEPVFDVKRSEIKDLLLKLPRVRTYQVDVFLEYYYGDDMTNEKLGEMFGYSKQNISLIMVNMMKKINKNETIKKKLRNLLNF